MIFEFDNCVWKCIVNLAGNFSIDLIFMNGKIWKVIKYSEI